MVFIKSLIPIGQQHTAQPYDPFRAKEKCMFFISDVNFN